MTDAMLELAQHNAAVSGAQNMAFLVATNLLASIQLIRAVLPLRMILGSQALESTLTTLRKRPATFDMQTALAGSTDFPPGE